MCDWVEMIIKKFCLVIWVEYLDIRLVMKHPPSANLSIKTVKNKLFVLKEIVVKYFQSMNDKVAAIIHGG